MDFLTQSMKLLSDETRLRIALLLYQGEFCVCQLTGITGIAQPKVSKAIGKMKDLDLLEDVRQDKYVYYKLKDEACLVHTVLSSIIETIDQHPLLLKDQKGMKKKHIYLSNCQGK